MGDGAITTHILVRLYRIALEEKKSSKKIKKLYKKFCTIKMDNFKQCHSIETDITLQSKVENDHLFVFYKDQWVQL